MLRRFRIVRRIRPVQPGEPLVGVVVASAPSLVRTSPSRLSRGSGSPRRPRAAGPSSVFTELVVPLVLVVMLNSSVRAMLRISARACSVRSRSSPNFTRLPHDHRVLARVELPALTGLAYQRPMPVDLGVDVLAAFEPWPRAPGGRRRRTRRRSVGCRSPTWRPTASTARAAVWSCNGGHTAALTRNRRRRRCRVDEPADQHPLLVTRPVVSTNKRGRGGGRRPRP